MPTTHIPITELLPDFLGHTVNDGRLHFVERLGSGAYGIVYKALDTTSPADSSVYYAVKCLYKYAIGTRESVFQARELKLHKLVSGHPNILRIHRYFTEGKHIFLVLDYCPGDLFVAIAVKHLFHRNTELIRHAFLQILDAVQHCHDRHVFHRDLKPENILYDSDGNIRLADFGLSTQSGRTMDAVGLGSPYYMSPEAVMEGGYSSRHSDIWALGVILTNLICGRNPWKAAEASDECFVSYLTDNDFLLKTLPISRGVNTLLKRCFRLNPENRPSISQIREEILKLDTFFLSEAELLCASSSQRAIDQYYAAPAPEGEFLSDSDCEGILCESPASGMSSADPDEVYLYNTPPFASPQLLAPPCEARFPGHSSSATASDASSESGGAPMTPATEPVDSSIDIVEAVPDLPEDQNIGESAAFPSRGPAQGPAKPTHISGADESELAKPALASRSFFKKTMKRIKAMGA